MSSSKTVQLTPLEELSFAPAKYPWDAEAAAERLEQALGWKALVLYSLWVDTSQDPESFEAYPMLVVDVVDGEPRVVPAALEAARKSLSTLEEGVRDSVASRLNALEQRLATVSKSAEESEAELREPDVPEGQEEQESSETKESSEPQAERLDTAERIIDRLASEGRLLPAWGREALVKFVAELSQEKTLTDDNYEPISPLDFFTRILESLPALVPLSEFASPQARVDNSFEALGHKIAKALK